MAELLGIGGFALGAGDGLWSHEGEPDHAVAAVVIGAPGWWGDAVFTELIASQPSTGNGTLLPTAVLARRGLVRSGASIFAPHCARPSHSQTEQSIFFHDVD